MGTAIMVDGASDGDLPPQVRRGAFFIFAAISRMASAVPRLVRLRFASPALVAAQGPTSAPGQGRLDGPETWKIRLWIEDSAGPSHRTHGGERSWVPYAGPEGFAGQAGQTSA